MERASSWFGLELCAAYGVVVIMAAIRLPAEIPAAQPRQPLHRAVAEGRLRRASSLSQADRALRHRLESRILTFMALLFSLRLQVLGSIHVPSVWPLPFMAPGRDPGSAGHGLADRAPADRSFARLRPSLLGCWRRAGPVYRQR